jgi:hypothetical protein
MSTFCNVKLGKATNCMFVPSQDINEGFVAFGEVKVTGKEEVKSPAIWYDGLMRMKIVS